VQRSRNGSLTSHQNQELIALVNTGFQKYFILKTNTEKREQLLNC